MANAGGEQPGVWRDEDRLPLEELTAAMGTYSADGQVDDATGGDASAEQEFGDEPWAVERPPDDNTRPDGPGDPDPDTVSGRRLRPSPNGRIGPV